MIHTLCFDYNF